VGLGLAFLRHVARCRVLVHVLDGTSDDVLGDFAAINQVGRACVESERERGGGAVSRGVIGVVV
jgi:GTPase involved in cell partitioning and DNA repair